MSNFIIQESATISTLRNVEKTPLGTIRFIAVMQEANRPNRNKRIYPKEIMEQALRADYIRERLDGRTLYGEAGHPLDFSVQRQTNIDQRNIAMLIEKLWWEGDLLMGQCETANTAAGHDMAGLIEQGSKIGISLRAQGGVERDPMTGYNRVKPGMQIVTWDWVVCPSHDKAFIQSILPETKMAMFGSENPSAEKIQEAQMLFESGQIFTINAEENTIITEDYIAGYNKKLRAQNEIYFAKEGDVLLTESIDGNHAEVKNGNTIKKVILEDFLTQDLRKAIANLKESKKEGEE